MSNREYQEFVIDTFASVLTVCRDKNYTEKVFLTVTKDLKSLINHYASIYTHNDSYENLWQNSKFEFYKPLLMSENAYHISKDKKGSYKKYKDSHKGNDDELLYWEHITPNEVVWKRICTVYSRFISNIIKENSLRHEIEKCFSNHRLVLLTKSESDKLDTEGGRTGQRIEAVRKSDANINVAAHRIKLLFDKKIVRSMYLGEKKLPRDRIVDNNGCFTDKGLEYFSNKDFTV